MTPDNKSRSRLFKNPFLEFITRAPYPVSFSYYVLLITGLLLLSNRLTDISVGKTLGLFFTGIFFWTLYEYLLHRFVFHFINENKIVKRIHYMMHGVHHDFPRDVERVTMPPVPGTLIAAILFSLHYLVLQNTAFAFVAGVLCGYNLYTLIHFATHAWKPVKGLKFWWSYHALHHYKYPDKAYGVSSPLWDYVFGTFPPRAVK
ncbi:MAG: sterol desaturase family protein [Chitinophagales bacterium]